MAEFGGGGGGGGVERIIDKLFQVWGLETKLELLAAVV